MAYKSLQQLLNSAKNRAIEGLSFSSDVHIADSILLSLSDDYSVHFTYNYNSLKGVYVVTSDSADLYVFPTTPQNTLQGLSSAVKEQFSDSKISSIRKLEADKIKTVVRDKFMEHGLQKLYLKTIPEEKGICYDILCLKTETSGLAFGMQYYSRKITYHVGDRKHATRGEFY